MSARYRTLAWVSAIVLILDQVTKLYVDSRFVLHESVTVLENFLHITYVRNKGAAFGILADNALRLPFFIGVSLVACIGILWYLHRTGDNQKLLHLALALIFGGAIGNFIDRVRLGEVIDFIYAHWYEHYWPAFNVADSAISVGVVLLLVDLWVEERRKKVP
ncbi:MAG: signal peptidase II [Desulfuromonas sp.]|nr:MAG: signal peptidase II [Desulfuromonas sp.]